MQEISVPSANAQLSMTSTAVCVFDNARNHPDRVALRRREGGGWRDVTSAQFAAEVSDLARGLLAPVSRVATASP